jgi:hypothetical protein
MQKKKNLTEEQNSFSSALAFEQPRHTRRFSLNASSKIDPSLFSFGCFPSTTKAEPSN